MERQTDRQLDRQTNIAYDNMITFVMKEVKSKADLGGGVKSS